VVTYETLSSRPTWRGPLSRRSVIIARRASAWQAGETFFAGRMHVVPQPRFWLMAGAI
jgi:hypothetical protein